jgi:hypothetical protein
MVGAQIGRRSDDPGIESGTFRAIAQVRSRGWITKVTAGRNNDGRTEKTITDDRWALHTLRPAAGLISFAGVWATIFKKRDHLHIHYKLFTRTIQECVMKSDGCV